LLQALLSVTRLPKREGAAACADADGFHQYCRNTKSRASWDYWRIISDRRRLRKDETKSRARPIVSGEERRFDPHACNHDLGGSP
jgi:hypothetical protein